jgi:hypothetical protein
MDCPSKRVSLILKSRMNAFKRNDLSAAVKRTFTEELTSEKCREKTSQR